MTLIEVIMALAVMLILIAGVLATFVQSRRLSAASIAQSCATTIVEGYIEQLKNIPLFQFINGGGAQSEVPQLGTSFVLPTMKDQVAGHAWIQLATTPSTVSAATMLNATPGTTPANVVDNLQSFDMDNRSATGTTTWALAWPNARNYPPSPPATPVTTPATPTYVANIPGLNDLRMNFWVQISDLTPTAPPKSKAYGILIVYTYQYIDGGKVKYVQNSVRTIRSAVQTF